MLIQSNEFVALNITDIWCHVFGIQWQNEWIASLVFETNFFEGEKYTPDVPSDITDWLEFITPDPVAPAAWSPAPPATITSFLNPISLANFLSTKDVLCDPSTNFGICSSDKYVKSNRVFDQRLSFTFNHKVPDASDISV